MAKREMRPAQNPLGGRIASNNAQASTLTLLGGEDKFVSEYPDAAVGEDGIVVIGHYQLTPVGLVDNGASAEEWEKIGRYFKSLTSSLTWLIADWMATGERVHKQSYEAASLLVGRKVPTLYNWASVARNVEISRRREILDFKHHVLIAPLDSEWQGYWLAWAEKMHWSANKLGRLMSQYPNGLPDGFTDAPALPPPKDPIDRFQVAFAPFQQKLTKIAKKAGKASRQQMAEWLRQEADRIEKGGE